MKQELYDQIYAIEHSHWWYVGRRRIIFDQLRLTLANLTNPRILDIGCGTGGNIEHFDRLGFSGVIGVDFSLQALRYSQSRHLSNLVCGDAMHCMFPSASFDLITALDVIEHIEDDQVALHELVNLLKPGGTLVIFTPAFMFLWGKQDVVSHHIRRYTSEELRRKMEEAGLKIDRLTYVNMILFLPIWLGRLALRLVGEHVQSVSENDLHPSWMNGVLQALFLSEEPILRRFSLPIGVSILAIAHRSYL